MKGVIFKTWPDKLEALREFGEAQTRRVIKPQPIEVFFEGDHYEAHWYDEGVHHFCNDLLAHALYAKGETLYVKEMLLKHPILNEAVYEADRTPVFVNQTIGHCLKWRWQRDWLSPMHLPEEAARYFIEILDINAQRVQEITEQEQRLEGITVPSEWYVNGHKMTRYGTLWDIINKDYSWDSNPYEFTYQFRLTQH